MPTAKTARHYYISGVVQGVAYRASALDEARRLGLTGWVRNVPDGRVEVFACGTPDQLEAYEDWLWQGPSAARVDSVSGTDVPMQGFDDFEIRR
jgi:acylphosphatase